MRDRHQKAYSVRPILAMVGFTITLLVGALPTSAPAAEAQDTAALLAQAPKSLVDIEAAGVQLAFDVASVKPSRSGGAPSSRFPLGPGDAYTAGNAFSATNQPLIAYVRFAYKLGQVELMGLPGWVYADHFDMEARVGGNPTKDQMRRMMQSLLRDRFKLATHVEQQTMPTLKLVVARPGRTGPQLQPHSEKNRPCAPPGTAPKPSTAVPTPTPPTSKSGLQLPEIPCGSIGQIVASLPERGRIGGRDVTIARIAAFLTNRFTGIERKVNDETGLSGTFDFSLEWTIPPAPFDPATAQLGDAGPTIGQALEEQLGLSLKSGTSEVAIRVFDRIERPSPN